MACKVFFIKICGTVQLQLLLRHENLEDYEIKKKLGERLRKHQSAYRFSLMSPLKGSPQFSSNYWRGNQTEVNQERVEINHCKNIKQTRLKWKPLITFLISLSTLL